MSLHVKKLSSYYLAAAIFLFVAVLNIFQADFIGVCVFSVIGFVLLVKGKIANKKTEKNAQ